MLKSTFYFIAVIWLLVGTHCRREDADNHTTATIPAGISLEPAVIKAPTQTLRTRADQTPASLIVEELPTATPMASPTPRLYYIQPGDTLLGIALANRMELQELLALNPGIDPNILQIDQAIILPVATESPLDTDSLFTLLDDLEIINVAFYEDQSGGFWFLGEVTNGSDLNKTGVVIELSLFDEAGREKAAIQTRPVVDILLSDSKIPFGRLISDIGSRPTAWQATIVQATVFNDTEAIYWGLLSEIAEVTITDRLATVEGRLTNPGPLSAETISLTATAYTQEGKIAGFRNQSLVGPLAPGEDIPFSIEILCAIEPAGEISLATAAFSPDEP